ncbi:hypothetical protein Q8G35_18650 [Peribacillus simplex]|uniref:Uncharacterized protein n=2 Tax=Peribacillus TaxID=2675229 RepID=A0AA90P4G4_9BACI|nr:MULTISPECIES: hypothetical protein [Peribacillus]MDP1420347.1 hypothetical protein [Peribacillus simplex]MDP1453428.1 hypothetical protein [Peribacillus frigoritolerans]
MKNILFAVASFVIIVSIVLNFGISDESEYKMCLGAQGISNTIAKVFGDETTNACNE